MNSFFNPNYTEDEVWDLLTQYLEKKHNVNTSTIQRGIYADLNRDGSILTLEDQEYEYATLFCYRNFNFNISGSIIYQLDPPLNDEFDLEAICQFLNMPFPKPMAEPELTPDQIAEKSENIRLLKLRKSNEDSLNFQKSKLKNIAIAALYCLEYNRASMQNNAAYHYGQINKAIVNSNYLVTQGIQNSFGAMVIASTPPTAEEYLDFLQSYKEISDRFGINFDELIEYSKTKISNDLQNIIPLDARKLGSLILPLKDISGTLISAVIIPDIPVHEDFVFIENVKYTGGVIQDNWEVEDRPNIYFITRSINDADAIKLALKDACVLITITTENTIKCLQEIQVKNPDAIAVIVIDNEYTRIKSHKHFKEFEKSPLSLIAQYLADNIRDTSNIGIIMPQDISDSEEPGELDEPITCISMADVLHKLGEEELKKSLDQQISELTFRRGNNDLELNYLLQLHADAHEDIYLRVDLTIPPLIQLNHEIDDATGISTQVPLINNHSTNTVLFQESRAEFKKWLSRPISEEIVQQERLFAEVMCNFAKQAKDISEDEITQILNSKSVQNIENIF